jgi:hypothetical protein
MKTSLYDLSENYYQALDFLTDPENDVDQQTALDTLESLDGELDDKLLNVARFIASMESQAEAIAEVEKRQKARRQALENKSDWLRDYLKNAMSRTGHNKVTAPDIAVSLAKTPAAVKILDESLIPANFWDVKEVRSISKTRIKECGGCEGAVIESGFRVAIK